MTPTPEPDVHHPHMAAHEALADDTWTWEAWCLYVAEAQEWGESPFVAMSYADAMMRTSTGERRAELMEMRARLAAMRADLELHPVSRWVLRQVDRWDAWRERRRNDERKKER